MLLNVREGLIYVIIPDSVTHIGNHAFSKCENLNSVTIPDSVTTYRKIGAFSAAIV